MKPHNHIIPAKRLQQVQEYYFSQKLAEVRELQRQGNPVINLGVGNPDLPTHPNVIAELTKAVKETGSNYYQSYRGIPELREAFAGWYEDIYNISLNAETEILPLMGSKEGIMHISMAFANPGDRVLLPDPGYPAYTSVSKLLGLDVQYYNLTEANQWMPDPGELNELVNDRTKIMWLNYPHMPSGVGAGREMFDKLVAFARSNNILLVNDNPYSLILNHEPLSLLSSDTQKTHVLELNSLSKSHNMAGWRIGVVAGSEENINHILKVKSNFDSGMFKPVQQAAAKALQLPASWYESINAVYEKRRRRVWELLDSLQCSYNKNSTGLFVWARIPDSYENGVALSDELLYDKSVFITPGIVFGSNGDRYVRVSLCAGENELKETLNRVKTTKSIWV
jgi:aspartate/methionine/tyrosine aminotransferase